MTNSEKYSERERCAKVCDAMAADLRYTAEKFATEKGRALHLSMAAGCAVLVLAVCPKAFG